MHTHGEVKRILITAGPTYEPIDSVRFIGNRSSGKLGSALADTAAERGWETTLLLGPMAKRPTDERVRVIDFQSTSDLDARLSRLFPEHNTLVMAAAVSDYRPVVDEETAKGKLRRGTGPLRLTLEPTPDLLARCARAKRLDQTVIGFALEPRDRLVESALSKLERKWADAIVANPLETMDADRIEAMMVVRAGIDPGLNLSTDGPIEKSAFAPWLLDRIEAIRAQIDLKRGARADA